MPAPGPLIALKRRPHDIAVVVIMIASFVLVLQHLGHAYIHTPDEVLDAIVARNFLKHPLTPTMMDHPYLPTDETDWALSHSWLFKPPVAMWQSAAMFAVFGVGTFALRFPSAVLATLSVGLTYLIGVRLLDRTSALIAAGLQAFSPAIFLLVQGYLFSDHVDVALLFWTQLAAFFLIRAIQDGKRRDVVLCGVFQGIAFLAKWYLALLVIGLAVTVWILPKIGLTRKEDSRLKGRDVLVIFACFIATIAPWLIYIGIEFPAQLAFMSTFVFRHLNSNMAGWAAPWDRLLFDYAIRIFYVFYPALLAAIVWATVRAWQRKHLGMWILLAWAFGVFAPNVLALTKTPPSTLIGWPACWLILGYVISSALRQDRWALGIWVVSALLAVFFLKNASIPGENMGFGLYFGSIFVENAWVLWHTLIALVAGGAIVLIARSSAVRKGLIACATIASFMLLVGWWGGGNDKSAHPRGYLYLSWKVTRMDYETPDFSRLGAYAQTLPPNAVILVRRNVRFEELLMQFAGDRMCYAIASDDWRPQARALIEAGALPYLLSPSDEPLPALYHDAAMNRTIYACTPAARTATQRSASPLIVSPD